MAITGAVSTALRQDAPYQAEIAMGAQLIMDFQGARSGRRPYYWYRGTRYTSPEKIPGWSFSRNSEAYAEDSAGNLIKFPANVPRITDRAFMIEEARTETCGNSGFDGVAVGALTDGGVIGTGGFITPSFAPGLTVSVVEIGSANGAPYVDIRVQGTPASSPHFTLFYQANSNAPAAITGEQWVNSAYIRLVGGSLSNVALVSLRVLELTTANAVSATQFAGITVDSNFSRKGAVFTLSGGASTAKARGAVAFSGSGAPVDYTVRIQLPNFQKAASVKSPILTLGTAATRAADNVSIAGQSVILGEPVSYGAELVVNGDFATDLASWVQANTGASTWTWESGVARANTNGADNARLRQAVPVVAGRSYVVTYGGTLSETALSVGSSVGGAELLAFGGRNRVFTATTNTAHLNFVTNGNAATLDNVSVREVIPRVVTLVMSADLPADDDVIRRLATITDSTLNRLAYLSRGSENSAGAFSRIDATTQASVAAGKSGARVLKVAGRYRPDGFVGAVDGVLTAPQALVPTGMHTLRLGVNEAGNFGFLNGYVQRVVILGDVTDAQLQRLST